MDKTSSSCGGSVELNNSRVSAMASTTTTTTSCCCYSSINILSSLPSPSLRSPSVLFPSSPSSSSVAVTAASLGSSPNNLPLKPSPSVSSANYRLLLCKAAVEYAFPDPIPEFAEAETNRFRTHLLEKLSKKKKDLFGDSIEEVVRVCSEILNNFLHTEYGGPGTLLVIPFIDMADTLNERGLPGGPQAARAAVVWAQKHVDKDWNEWTKGEGKQ